MSRRNCWEYFKCGREPGGSKADELGICPVTVDETYDEINRGKNAGRCCWMVDGICGEIHGTFAQKFENCIKCPFFQEVAEDEGRFFVITPRFRGMAGSEFCVDSAVVLKL